MTIPETKCKTCGRNSNGLPECHDCWEVEIRLPRYLSTVNGRNFVKEKLEAAEKDVQLQWLTRG